MPQSRSAAGDCDPLAEDLPPRERILAAAFAAFTQHGFAQASTLEIATRARVSKRELYALFGSKQQMLVTCISERAQRMRLPADWPPVQNSKQLQAALDEFGSVLLREISDPDVIATFRLAIAEADRSPEVAQALDEHGRNASRAAVRGLVVQAQASGLLAGMRPEDVVELYLSLLIGDLVMGLALGLAKRPADSQLRLQARRATQAVLHLAKAAG